MAELTANDVTKIKQSDQVAENLQRVSELLSSQVKEKKLDWADSDDGSQKADPYSKRGVIMEPDLTITIPPSAIADKGPDKMADAPVKTSDAADVDVDKEAERMARLILAPESSTQRSSRLRVTQADPRSHLSSIKTFEDLKLPDALLRGIRAMGFEKPSSIQEVSLPLIIRNPPENFIGQAQSGSGKTVAFCLGLLYRIDTRLPHLQALVITPTRELAVQCVNQTLIPMAQYLQPQLKVLLALSGTKVASGEKMSDHVVVGTPGKVEDFLKRGSLDCRHLKVFVLDEADAMMGLGNAGFGENCKRIRKYLRNQHQSLLFSATFPPEVLNFARRIIPNPINEIRLRSDEELVLEEIKQFWIDLRSGPRDARLTLLKELYVLLEIGQSIIFCRTKRECDAITNALQDSGFNCSNLHGDLDGNARDACMEDFRVGRNKVLITTNVLARGVDVPAVSLVVNYDMPVMQNQQEPDFETYLHRIGRTGRFGRKGIALNLIENEDTLSVMQRINLHFSPGKEMIIHAPSDLEALERLVVKEAEG